MLFCMRAKNGINSKIILLDIVIDNYDNHSNCLQLGKTDIFSNHQIRNVSAALFEKISIKNATSC